MYKQFVPPYTWVDDEEGFKKFEEHVIKTGECALDTETTGLDRTTDYIIIWSACPDIHSRYVFPAEMLPYLRHGLFRLHNINWYFSNQNFDLSMLENTGVPIPCGDIYDTILMDWLYDENNANAHGLKETSLKYLELNMREYKDVFPKQKRGETIPERFQRILKEDPNSAKDYASLDSWATFRVFHFLREKLENDETSMDGTPLIHHYREVEFPFSVVLHKMNRRGIKLDRVYLESLKPLILPDIEKVQKQLNKIAGYEINPNSPTQMRKLFFDILKLKPVKYTSGGDSGIKQPSTDEECLSVWASQEVEAAKIMIEQRTLQKFLGTYVVGMLRRMDRKDRVHTTLNQHIAVTGRLTSSDPNLQNIPRPDGDKYKIRKAFISENDHVLICADYKQIEMRILAHWCKDENFIKNILSGRDTHINTASLMFGYKYEDIEEAVKKHKRGEPLSELEKQMVFSRQAAKTLGFGLNYGEGAKALGKSLGVSTDTASKLIEEYFRPYPKMKSFIYSVHHFILDQHRVETILGRPRRFPGLEYIKLKLANGYLSGSEKRNLAEAERQSVNSIIQGSVADLMRLAMIACEWSCELRTLKCFQLLQIHDELLFECPEKHVEEAIPIVTYLMENSLPMKLLVPIEIDIGYAKDWSSAKL